MTTAQTTMNLFKTSPVEAYEMFKRDETALEITFEKFVTSMNNMIARSNQNEQSEVNHKEVIETNY